MGYFFIRKAIDKLNTKGLLNFLPDKLFVQLIYWQRMGKKLDLNTPHTFNEKLQWLKLYERKPIYTIMVDKYEVKKYISSIIGDEHIIPTLGVWERVEDIDFNSLPNEFVLKCTHNSGGLVICRNKSTLDIEKTKEKLISSLKKNFYFHSREWPYKDVKPRIICEKLMVDESGFELKDYKWFCFDGEPKAMFIATDRFVDGEETKFDFFDMDFNHFPFRQGHPNATKKIEKPRGFETMKHLARKLSNGIPHVRVDFYDINGQIYFGEMTFFHFSGMVPFVPENYDELFGSWIRLDK